MIIPIHIKSATILKCQTVAKRHPLVRALNIKFGIWDECQLVFRIYEKWHLRTDTLTARLAIAGPEDGQRWEHVIDIDDKYIPMLTAWYFKKKCKPFTFYLSVTEEIEERIKQHQHFFWRASYPTRVGQGFPTNNTIQPCQTNQSKSSPKLPLKQKKLKRKSLEKGPAQSPSKPLKLKLSLRKKPESESLKSRSETGSLRLKIRKMKLRD